MTPRPPQAPHVSAIAFLAVCVLGLVVTGCRASSAREPEPTGRLVAARKSALFKDMSAAAGIRFRHSSGAAGKFYFIENTAAGCAFLDYDNDGFLDIVLLQSGPSDRPETVKNRPYSALYRNRGDGTFADVTVGSGLDRDLGYVQGIAVGDYDNDGFADLFITAYGSNHLLRNAAGSVRTATSDEEGMANTEGKPDLRRPVFQDVTVPMGLGTVHGDGYATSAAFGDYDNDGRLDLYVCYYAQWSWETDKPCRDSAGRKEYCTPELYEPDSDRLYRNEGGRFLDVSDKAGIAKTRGRGLSAAFIDYDQDGRQDIFVANDLTPNFLWRNNGNGTFTDVALDTGCAYDLGGALLAGMGIGVADYDHSGFDSLFVGNFSDKPNTLYKNLGNGRFRDESMSSGLAVPHMKFLTFGCEFLDYDADGWQDLINANGHVQVNADLRMEQVTYKERKQLFHNEGNAVFREVTDLNQLGDLAVPAVSRGLAAGDYDNDGRMDVLVSNQNDPAQLLRNQDASGRHWVAFLPVGTKSNRDGRHARFVVEAGSMRQTATVRGGSSYLSHRDRRVNFGLGTAHRIDQVIVSWPSGTTDRLTSLQPDRMYIVTEGKGISGTLPIVKANGASTVQ